MKKDIEWLKKEFDEVLEFRKQSNPSSIWDLGTNTVLNYIKKDFKNLINQLDEPEVLSQEESINIVLDDLKEYIKEQRSLSQNVGLAHTSAGNDTHYRQYDYVLECVNEYEPSDDLQNLLVPKQELPVVPKFVAEWIEINRDVYENIFLIGYDICNNDIQPDVDDWIMDNEEKFVRAWLDGYEVEEEQKYIIKIGNLYLAEPLGDMTSDIVRMTRDKEIAYQFADEKSIATHLDKFEGTEAVKVEELEE